MWPLLCGHVAPTVCPLLCASGHISIFLYSQSEHPARRAEVRAPAPAPTGALAHWRRPVQPRVMQKESECGADVPAATPFQVCVHAVVPAWAGHSHTHTHTHTHTHIHIRTCTYTRAHTHPHTHSPDTFLCESDTRQAHTQTQTRTQPRHLLV